MRNRRIVLVLAPLLITAGCAADEPAGPVELAEQLLVAEEEGDNARWRELMDDAAVTLFDDGTQIEYFSSLPGILDDFDGDGVFAYADDVQFRNAMHGPAQQSMEWECEEVAPNRATCRVTTTDCFIQYGDGPAAVMDMTLTFAEGKCVQDSGTPADEAGIMASFEAWDAGLAAYQQWVSTNHPESYDTLFSGACCSAMMRISKEAVDLHGDLLPEFLAAAN